MIIEKIRTIEFDSKFDEIDPRYINGYYTLENINPQNIKEVKKNFNFFKIIQKTKISIKFHRYIRKKKRF